MVQTGKYDAINTTDKNKMGSYVIKFFSEAYTIKEETNFNRKISTSDEIFDKSQYMDCMQDYTNCYCEQIKQQNNIIVLKRIIVSPCLYVMSVTEKKYLIMYATETKHERLYKDVLYV